MTLLLHPMRGPASAFLIVTFASVLTPGQTQCHVVTIFGLKTADCNKQNAKVIPRTLDRDLQVVRFDDNRLVKLDSDAFRIYPNLQEIYLARNRIESITEKAFHGQFSLQILDLEGNQLASIPSDSFQAISSLRMLSLKGNPIRRIEMEALVSLRNVEELNFENCWLDSIDPAAFRGLDKLVEINLVNNELHGLHPDMASSLPASLSVLRLYRNPWTCSCRLRWLRKWISAPGSVNWDFATNTPTCAAPELIKGVAWKHLTPDQFACPTRIVFNATRTSATVEQGHNVTLECLAIGDPEPSVRWIRDDGKTLPRGAILAENRGPTEFGERLVTSVVTMLSVGHEEAGDYRCSAENSAGRSEMTYKVTVHELGASAIGSGRLDADRETLLGVIVGIGVLVVIVVAVTVCRVKFRQCQKRGYDEDVYAKNLTPLTKKKDTTEEEEVDSEEEEDNDEDEEEEEQDDSSFADSFNFQAKSIGNAKTDSTLQSLLGPRKSNAAAADSLLPGRSEDLPGSGESSRTQTHNRRQKARQRDRVEEDDDDEEEMDDGYKTTSAAKQNHRCSSVAFDEASPSPPSASDKSDRSSSRTDSDIDQQHKSTPDLLSSGGGGVIGGGCGGKAIRRPASSRLQVSGQQVTRSDRSVSFCATPHEAHTKDERSSRLSLHREASSSAETLVIDDVLRRTDAHSKTEGPREETEEALMGLTSNGRLSPTAIRFPTIDRPKPAGRTPVGHPGRVSHPSNSVHFPEHSLSQADLVKSSNSEGSYSSLGKSCLRKKPHNEFPPNDAIPTTASGTRDRNLADVTPESKRSKVDANRRRQEHQRLLPRIPSAVVSFRDGPQRLTADAVGNGPTRDRPSMGGGSNRGHIENGLEAGSMRGSPGRIGGFMHDSLRWIEGSLQRMVDVGLPGSLITNSHDADPYPSSNYQKSLLTVNAPSISPPTSSTNLRRDTNTAFPTRPFDTLPIMPCSSRGQSSNRPDSSSIVNYAASDRLNNRTSCFNQNYDHPLKSRKQPHLVPQQQQHQVTLLSDILLSPFGKEPATSSSNTNDVRTRADSRRNTVLGGGGDDDDDDAGTAL